MVGKHSQLLVSLALASCASVSGSGADPAKAALAPSVSSLIFFDGMPRSEDWFQNHIAEGTVQSVVACEDRTVCNVMLTEYFGTSTTSSKFVVSALTDTACTTGTGCYGGYERVLAATNTLSSSDDEAWVSGVTEVSMKASLGSSFSLGSRTSRSMMADVGTVEYTMETGQISWSAYDADGALLATGGATSSFSETYLQQLCTEGLKDTGSRLGAALGGLVGHALGTALVQISVSAGIATSANLPLSALIVDAGIAGYTASVTGGLFVGGVAGKALGGTLAKEYCEPKADDGDEGGVPGNGGPREADPGPLDDGPGGDWDPGAGSGGGSGGSDDCEDVDGDGEGGSAGEVCATLSAANVTPGPDGKCYEKTCDYVYTDACECSLDEDSCLEEEIECEDTPESTDPFGDEGRL